VRKVCFLTPIFIRHTSLRSRWEARSFMGMKMKRASVWMSVGG